MRRAGHHGAFVVNNLVGQTLGKYRVMDQIGRGGMAVVFRAYHPQLDRYVAVKVLQSFLVEGEDFRARFDREAKSVAKLRHPNIVQVFDFDVQEDLPFMVISSMTKIRLPIISTPAYKLLKRFIVTSFYYFITLGRLWG